MQAVPFFVFTSPLQFQRSRSMRHLMPIVTPRLILRPPTLGGGMRRRDGHDQIQHPLEGRAGADDSLKTIGAFRFRGPNWTHSATERLHTLRPK